LDLLVAESLRTVNLREVEVREHGHVALERVDRIHVARSPPLVDAVRTRGGAVVTGDEQRRPRGREADRRRRDHADDRERVPVATVALTCHASRMTPALAGHNSYAGTGAISVAFAISDTTSTMSRFALKTRSCRSEPLPLARIARMPSS